MNSFDTNRGRGAGASGFKFQTKARVASSNLRHVKPCCFRFVFVFLLSLYDFLSLFKFNKNYSY